jgi:hypothetical protein
MHEFWGIFFLIIAARTNLHLKRGQSRRLRLHIRRERFESRFARRQCRLQIVSVAVIVRRRPMGRPRTADRVLETSSSAIACAGGKKPVSPDTAHPALDLAGDALEHQRLAVWPVDQPVPPIAGLSAERENPDDLGAALEFAQDRGWMSDRVLASAGSAWGADMILTTRSSARACARRG